MNTFKRKSLNTAVLAGLATIVTGGVQAVHINPDGHGQALVYPYYTVRAVDGGTSTAYYDTYLSVVNTTNSTKAVKVRFLEGKRSAEVLDFNLYLSPLDVWTGAVVRTANGARLISADKSCVAPSTLFTDTGSVTNQNTLNVFKNYVYSNGGDSDASLDRVREGHFEILEMGVVTDAALTANIKHGSNGIPANCAAVANRDLTTGLGNAISAPTGGLFGAASLINVMGGTDVSYDAIALDNWYDSRNGPNLWTRADSLEPKLTAGGNTTSDVFLNGFDVFSTWPTSRDAVSAVFMHDSVMNEYTLDSATRSGTDWIVTFPTKAAYVGFTSAAAGTGPRSAIAPFNANFSQVSNTSCDRINFGFVDREEQQIISTIPSNVSPAPILTVNPLNLCYEANVVTFNNSNNLGSVNSLNIPVPYENGWGRLTFTETFNALTPTSTIVYGSALPNAPRTHFGLPVAGLMVQDFINANLVLPGQTQSVFSVYGGQFHHKFTTRIGG